MKGNLGPLLALLAGALALIPGRGASRKGFDLDGFSRLPVLEGGRIKPLDTVARSSLLMLRGRQSLEVDGRSLSAPQWLLDVMSRPEAADVYRIFSIEDPDLLGLLGRERAAGKYLSFVELEPHAKEIARQAARASQLEGGQRSRFEAAVVNLEERLNLYQSLKNTLQVEGTADMPGEIEAFKEALPAGLKALSQHMKSASFDRKPLEVLSAFFERYRFLAEAAHFRALPPRDGERVEDWADAGTGLLEGMRGESLRPALTGYPLLLRAYRDSKPEDFNAALANYSGWLKDHQGHQASLAKAEAFFNRAEPFYRGMLLYLGVFVLILASWVVKPQALRRSAYALLSLAFSVHTAGLIFRSVLQGRPPVTNLYSSAIFVGWAAVLLGIALERLYRNGFGALVSAATGFSTLIIAHHLTGQGDTLEMMRAVLDSNFWLSTHVVCITIGYSSMFLASALAHVHILRGFFGASDKDSGRSLAAMTYGIICFALLFSFVGTILGGIWADQSWGRFWGWDPKENGALLIVLWNAIVLHARWGGYVRERGVMLMAVFGGIVTSFSWFGVNMLGVGLHSYGFMDKAFYWLIAFVNCELAVMLMGGLAPRLSSLSLAKSEGA